jgi:hypothetical protein
MSFLQTKYQFGSLTMEILISPDLSRLSGRLLSNVRSSQSIDQSRMSRGI